ncbi:MAG: hypothetical protein JWM37_481 [Candidatus Saccharibacteria bacterium]|nr:hypothetical protein [Candidatus Saccharibacteria bacterium]
MSGLETAFYIIGITFMAIMLVLVIVLVVAVFVIRSKVNKIHAVVDEKINNLSHVMERGGEIAGTVFNTGKKILNKKK